MPQCLIQLNHRNEKLCMQMTNLLMPAKTEEELKINSLIEFANIQNCPLQNNLVINKQKTLFIIQSKQNRHNSELHTYIDDNSIEEIESATFLGVHIDSHLLGLTLRLYV